MAVFVQGKYTLLLTIFAFYLFALQDSMGGLEVKNVEGKWVSADPIPGDHHHHHHHHSSIINHQTSIKKDLTLKAGLGSKILLYKVILLNSNF